MSPGPYRGSGALSRDIQSIPHDHWFPLEGFAATSIMYSKVARNLDGVASTCKVLWRNVRFFLFCCGLGTVNSCSGPLLTKPLRWRHNDHAGVSNHQPHGCLLNRLFRRKSKKTSKLRVTGLCARNSPGTGVFPAQMASYAENVSIWWRHHAVAHLTANTCGVSKPRDWIIMVVSLWNLTSISAAAVNFQSDWKCLNSNVAASRLH